MHKIPLCSHATATTLTVWWEPPRTGPAGPYALSLDGGAPVETERTHHTFSCLAPDSPHSVTLLCGGELAARADLRTAPARKRLDVRGFGAAGDGQTMDTAALQAAIDACGPQEEVWLPAGVWRTGALRLHSDMALYLDEGAVLQGTDRPEDYEPRIPSRFEGIERECYSSLLNLGQLDRAGGPNARNVLIYGRGVIASGGQTLALRVIEQERQRLARYLSENAALVAACENDSTIPGRVRPRLINLSNCENVRISGLRLQNGASWNVHMIYSRGIVTDHCTFCSDGVWNGDGWDPDSSEDCTLFACRFFTGDDSVAIKSGKNPEGNAIARPTRRIRIFDCVSELGHGIAIGSEISGGVEDVHIWDCDLANSTFGVEIKATAKRGGYVRDLAVTDCVLPRVLLHSVPYNDDGEAAPAPPVFERCRYERLKLLGRYRDTHGDKGIHPCTAVEIAGFAQPGYEVKDILFRDIVMPAGRQGLLLERCAGVRFEGLSCGCGEA